MALHKDAAMASVTLAPDQSEPVPFERLSLSKVRVPKTVVRRQVHFPVTAAPLDSIEAPSSALVSSGASVPARVDGLMMKAKCESSGRRPPIGGGGSQTRPSTEGASDGPTSVLTSLDTNWVDPSTIVIGDVVTRCGVVDLQGDVVVQEHPSAPSGPYMVDERLLVQVAQEEEEEEEEEPGRARTNESSSRAPDGSPSCGRGNKDDTSRKRTNENEVANSNDGFGDGAKSKNHSNFESRWNYHKVFVKSECPLITKASPEDIVVEVESESEDVGRPRRKSARRARLRWKSTHDVDNFGKIGAKRSKCMHFLSRDKHGIKMEKPVDVLVPEQLVQDLPVWAQRLTSVRVLDNKWVVGVAPSSNVLQQTLEGHSRSVLCDYIKSHPSSLQQRHRTRLQASRIMWHHQRIKFDGVPFTILSSDDLKCAFGMNYKIKRKDSENTSKNKQQTGKTEENFGQDGRVCEDTGESEKRKVNKVKEVKETLPKKRYKDVTYTSCTAKITVKVITKYPGYAVSFNALASERKVMLRALRRDMGDGLNLEKEELYHVTLPLSSVHNHPLQGRSRGIHPSITSKIKELVGEGVTTPKVIKGILDNHVEMQHVGDMVVPQTDDRAYYPRLKDIANLVYTLCKKMGISAKRKVSSEQQTFETIQKKKRKRRRTRSDDENEVVCSDNAMSDNVPLQASTLQEAVQTFCTDEPDRGTIAGLEGQECISSDVAPRDESEVTGLAEMVRGQLDTLRSLTYSLHEVGSLQEMYQSLQVILNQYMTNSQHTLQEGIAETPAATAFIIQEPLVDSLSSTTSQAQGLPESAAEHLVIAERDGTGSGVTGKPRNAQNVGSQPVRQLRPPVALQCLTTNVLPTLAMSQLPRSTSQNPHQPHTHIVTSVSHGGNNPATATIPQPTYQTLGPAIQDGSPAPVHLSLPPYFYYVQEVTVPESSQNWTYTTPS